MACKLNIPLPHILPHLGNVQENFRDFSDRWNNFEIASRLKTESSEYRCSILLSAVGEHFFKVIQSFTYSNEGTMPGVNIKSYGLGRFRDAYDVAVVGGFISVHRRVGGRTEDEILDDIYSSLPTRDELSVIVGMRLRGGVRSGYLVKHVNQGISRYTVNDAVRREERAGRSNFAVSRAGRRRRRSSSSRERSSSASSDQSSYSSSSRGGYRRSRSH